MVLNAFIMVVIAMYNVWNYLRHLDGGDVHKPAITPLAYRLKSSVHFCLNGLGFRRY